MTRTPDEIRAEVARVSADDKEVHRLIGLNFGISDVDEDDSWTDYDLGLILIHALDALKVGVLAVEQCVSGEKLLHSLDIGDFYSSVNSALEQENGQGILSEPGSMAPLQGEIDGLRDLAVKARKAGEDLHGSREKLAAFMIARSIPTGHGDTIEALLGELGGGNWLDERLATQPTLEGR